MGQQLILRSLDREFDLFHFFVPTHAQKVGWAGEKLHTEGSGTQSRKRISLTHESLTVRRRILKGIIMRSSRTTSSSLADPGRAVENSIKGTVVDARAQCAIMRDNATFFPRRWWGWSGFDRLQASGDVSVVCLEEV